MIVVCIHRWRREFTGAKPVLNTFGPGALIVVAYYAILITWFWRMVPESVAVQP